MAGSFIGAWGVVLAPRGVSSLQPLALCAAFWLALAVHRRCGGSRPTRREEAALIAGLVLGAVLAHLGLARLGGRGRSARWPAGCSTGVFASTVRRARRAGRGEMVRGTV